MILAIWGALSIPALSGMTVLGGCGGKTAEEAEVTANAGPDQTVEVGTLTTLDGSASTGVTSSLWTITSKPAGATATLTNETTLSPSLTPDVEGDYVVELSVNEGAATDTVTVTATASSAASFTIPAGSPISTRTRYGETEFVVNLDEVGAKLTVAGEVAALALKDAAATSFVWEQVSGPEATIIDGASATLEFDAPGLKDMQTRSDRFKWQILPVSREDTKMVFKVTLSDGVGTATAFVSVFLQDDGMEIHTSSGLPNVPLGAVVYLNGPEESEEAPAPGEITDWTWTLVSRPAGSAAVFNDTGTDTSNLQMPRFTPDVAGIYEVGYSSTTSCVPSTVVSTIDCPGTFTITAGNYVGVGTIGGTAPMGAQCGTCHDGVDVAGLGDKVSEWSGTEHHEALEENFSNPHREYFTVGYNLDADNFGFDDLLSAAGLGDLPATYDDLLADHPSVAKLANVQCENCHGPGSNHSGDPTYIAKSFAQAGVCGQCHRQEAQWVHSKKNSDEDIESWVGTSATSRCSRCHNAFGFVYRLETGQYVPGTAPQADTGAFPGITCAACHDPHDATNPFQLRAYGDVMLVTDGRTNVDSTYVVDAGPAAVCYMCHDGDYRQGAVQCDEDRDGTSETVCTNIYQTATQSSPGGPSHHCAQSVVLEGTFAITDLDDDGTQDLVLDENSFHTSDTFILADVTGNPDLPSENLKCVTCHMADGPALGEPGHNEIGGHAFAPEAADGTQNLSACTVCHGDKISEANGGYNRRARADYDGDGVVEGIQDEIKGLLTNVGNVIIALDTANLRCGSTNDTCNGVTMPDRIRLKSGKNFWDVATGNTNPWAAKSPAEQTANKKALAEIHNFNMQYSDGSIGIHNAAYSIQVLQETYRAVTGNAYNVDFPLATLR